MTLADPRGARLRVLDAKLLELSVHRLDSPDGPDTNGGALCDLAIAIAGSMSEWNEIMRGIRVERSSRFEPMVAGCLAIESVFDALLDGPSLGVLMAAFELAATPR
jgi:hypothetical protein